MVLIVAAIGLLATAPLALSSSSATRNESFTAFGDISLNDGHIGGSVGLTKTVGPSASNVSVKLTLTEDITCADGEPGVIQHGFFGITEEVNIAFDNRLARATASGTLNGTDSVFNTCDGSYGEQPRTASFVVVFTATGGPTTTRSQSETTYPDKHKDISKSEYDSRPAAGSVRIDSTTYSFASGLMDHSVSSFRTTPGQ